MFHKWWNVFVSSAVSNTGACMSVSIMARNCTVPLITTSSKAPDVFTGRTMRDTYSIKIDTVNWQMLTKEGTWRTYLVADDPPTHLVILLTTSGIVEPLTTTLKDWSSPTHSVWGGDLLPHRGTSIIGVSHVEVSYTSPAICSTTGVVIRELQRRYYWLTEQTLCSSFDLVPRCPLMFLRGTDLPAISLQDSVWVCEGKGGGGCLGNAGWARTAKLATAMQTKYTKAPIVLGRF